MFSCVGIGNRESSFGFGELSSLESGLASSSVDFLDVVHLFCWRNGVVRFKFSSLATRELLDHLFSEQFKLEKVLMEAADFPAAPITEAVMRPWLNVCLVNRLAPCLDARIGAEIK